MREAGEMWRPIQSAPLDGSKVDLWVPERGRVCDCWWGKPAPLGGSPRHPAYDGLPDGWCVEAETDGCSIVEYVAPHGEQPTHFRPVPEGPESEADHFAREVRSIVRDMKLRGEL